MAFSTTDLSNVESAIATGELTVDVNGRRVTYRSLAELKEARAIIQADLATAGTIASVPRTSRMQRTRD